MKKEAGQPVKNALSRFGFIVSPDRQIDFDNNQFEVYNHVKDAEPSIAICISCGTCSATCTAGKFTDFSLHKVILRVKRGETRGLKSDAAKCMLCGKCILACPRGVNTRNLILQINKALLLTP